MDQEPNIRGQFMHTHARAHTQTHTHQGENVRNKQPHQSISPPPQKYFS